jgi:prolipoprotein diacylglyceryl transferase
MATLGGVGLPATLPSPEQAVWFLGPLPIRAYALCILLGILAAIYLSFHRIRARGGTGEEIYDIAGWAVGFGIVGGRLYHVVSSPRPYFGENGDPLDAFKIWQGGLGIWGAIALGAVGAYIGCRRHDHSFADLADAIAPGLLVAQALGRWGNYFNNELYGGPSEAPWALQIHEWDPGAGRAAVDSSGDAVVLGTFQPTFLYESLWVLLVAVLIVVWDRRHRFARGQVFALYLMGYTLGRFFIELMRTDPAEIVLGQRVNVWVSVAIFVLGLVLYIYRGLRADYPPRGAAHLADPDVATEEERDGAVTGEGSSH